MSCPDCCNLIMTLDSIQAKANKTGDPDIIYGVKRYTGMILEWMRHSLRSVQQNKAKQDVMGYLESGHSALWLKEWAQKALPISFRENQADYFGKKGMSLAVDVFYREKT